MPIQQKRPGRPIVMQSTDTDAPASLPIAGRRNQSVAKRVLKQHNKRECCVICGLQGSALLEAAHLDHRAANNDPENLAWLCSTHHRMYDANYYPIEAIVLLRNHWQTGTFPNHKPRMKDAGAKAALTRKLSAAAQKAVATRRANAKKRT